MTERCCMLYDYHNQYLQYNNFKIKFAGLCNIFSKVIKFQSVKSKRRGENAQKVKNN